MESDTGVDDAALLDELAAMITMYFVRTFEQPEWLVDYVYEHGTGAVQKKIADGLPRLLSLARDGVKYREAFELRKWAVETLAQPATERGRDAEGDGDDQ